ncbi:HalOD1 output domain-containing protein [Haloarcula nitratireducens]|uniref:Halobacterial output domain-containing protein n=1 Tax=Haloarcula nitratireducens TaxID=2487749 RepID=A0AAW4PEN0_9EURY|nr:HalOD1 output domain-containing protein [Halomicroarcula nitratireducens]MBX0295722.1 hypothetical protein [Halomicroarcula nitratireducens]
MSKSFDTADRERASVGAVSEQFDWAETEPSMAVVETIAAATGRTPAEGTPIYESVDAEAIDTLFGSGNDSPDRRFSFTHEGLTVTVAGDGTVSARPAV